jgi:hypothetical protein
MVLEKLSQVRGTTSNLRNPLLTRSHVGLKRRYCIRYGGSMTSAKTGGSSRKLSPLSTLLFFCQQHIMVSILQHDCLREGVSARVIVNLRCTEALYLCRALNPLVPRCSVKSRAFDPEDNLLSIHRSLEAGAIPILACTPILSNLQRTLTLRICDRAGEGRPRTVVEENP